MKKKLKKQEVGFAILLAVMFCMLGFLGSIAANFIFWSWQNDPKLLRVVGFITTILFFIVAILLMQWGKKLFDEKKN